MSSPLTDPGIISVNQSGRVLTTHFSTDLFQSDGSPGANKILAFGGGEITIEGGFASSLATALSSDPTLRIDLTGDAKLEIVADVADLIALAQELENQGLSLEEFFEGSGEVVVILDEPDPAQLALLANVSGLPLVGEVKEVTTSGSGTLELPAVIYSDDFDVSGFTSIVVIGTGNELADFRSQEEGDLVVPNAVLDKVIEYRVTSGILPVELNVFTDSGDTTLFTAVGVDATDSAEVRIIMTADEAIANELIDFSPQTSSGSYGFVGVEISDLASELTLENANLPATVGGFTPALRHVVTTGSDTITLTAFADTIEFHSGALNNTFSVTGNFDPTDDRISLSPITGYDHEFAPTGDFARDVTFIDGAEELGNLDGQGTNANERLEIRISSGSTHIDFNGLDGSYENNNGTEPSPDLSLIFPNDVVALLNADAFNGFPLVDEITLQDFINDEIISLEELQRFDSLIINSSFDELGSAIWLGLIQHFPTRFAEVSDFVLEDGTIIVDTVASDTITTNNIIEESSTLVLGLNGGNDTITSGAGFDFIRAGSGNDRISVAEGEGEGFGLIIAEGGAGDDSIIGGDFDDFLSGNYLYQNDISGSDRDTVHGGDGEDLILGGYDDDYLYGGDGQDFLSGGEGNDIIFAGNDDDFVVGGAPMDDFLSYKFESEIIDFSYYDGADTIYGGPGNDILDGYKYDDVIHGDDSEFGTNGADTIYGGHGNDEIYGKFDDDVIEGNEHSDYIDGGQGDDFIDGGSGADTLLGGDGNDTIDGSFGNDEIWGGLGRDELSGGGGNDIFTLTSKNDSPTLIKDFDGDGTVGGGTGTDKLQLPLDFFGTGTSQGVFPIYYTSYTTPFSTSDGAPVTAPVVYSTSTHIHVLQITTSDGSGSNYTTDWYPHSPTIQSLPLATRLTSSAYDGIANPAQAFSSFLTGLTAPTSERFVTFNTFPVTTTYTTTNTKTSGGTTTNIFTKTFTGSTRTVTFMPGTARFIAFGIVDRALVMATIHNGPASGSLIAPSEVLNPRTIATFSDPSLGTQAALSNFFPAEIILL